MSLEIERKFLVKSREFLEEVTHSSHIEQFYLFTASSSETLRLRIVNSSYILTQKGLPFSNGLVREEIEKEITKEEAMQLLEQGFKGKIEKERYYVPKDKVLWEVDIFHGNLEGLIMAEVELEREDQEFDFPEWLGKEVTGDKRYYNLFLSQIKEKEETLF